MCSNRETQIKITQGNFVNFNKGNIQNDYHIDEESSRCFSTIRKIKNKTTEITRALKVIKKSSNNILKTFNDVDLLKNLIHPNIMQILEIYEDKNNLYLVCEFCEGEDLFDQILKKVSFTEDKAAGIIKQILSALTYIHSNNIVHRDIKPENILLDSNNDDSIKIIDWGTARYFNKKNKLRKVSGSPYYIAPEVLLEKYDEKCDIWSCGVIMYTLLCGYPPFNGETDVEILNRIRTGKFIFPDEEWEFISPEAKDLIRKMLKYNPSKRLSGSDCIQHAWFSDHINKHVDLNLSSRCLSNMTKFNAQIKLQQAGLIYIVNYLISNEEKSEHLKVFNSLDKNGDGVLSKDEMFEAYKITFGKFEALTELDSLLKKVDIDKNKYVDYNEFLISAMNRQLVLNKEKLEQTFKMFDSNGNGRISLDEIKNVLGNNGFIDRRSLKDIIKECDKDGDGEISMNEFEEIMLKK